MPPVVDAIVLAAGSSGRTRPVFKLLADLGGRPVISWVLDAVGQQVRNIVIVTAGHEELETLVRGWGRVVRNPRPEDGMGSSLRVGLTALGRSDAVLQVLGDMPMVREADVRSIVEAARPDRVVVPVRGGVRGHPVAWGAELVPRLLALGPSGKASDVLAGAPVVEVEAGDDGVLLDVDTPEALEAARRRFARSGRQSTTLS